MYLYWPIPATQFLYAVFDTCEEVNKNDLKIKNVSRKNNAYSNATQTFIELG